MCISSVTVSVHFCCLSRLQWMESGNYVLMLVDPSNFLALMVTLLFSIGSIRHTQKMSRHVQSKYYESVSFVRCIYINVSS